jgi:hypothetical protein
VGAYGRPRRDPLADEPLEEPSEYAEQLVIAPGPRPRAARQEVGEQLWGDVLDPGQRVVDEKTIEQAQLLFLGVEPSTEVRLLRNLRRMMQEPPI